MSSAGGWHIDEIRVKNDKSRQNIVLFVGLRDLLGRIYFYVNGVTAWCQAAPAQGRDDLITSATLHPGHGDGINQPGVIGIGVEAYLKAAVHFVVATVHYIDMNINGVCADLGEGVMVGKEINTERQ